MSPTPTPPKTGLRGWLAEMRATWWIYPLLGLFLTVVGAPISIVHWQQWLLQLALNTTIGACIGLAVTAIYAFVVHRLSFYEGRWFWPINALALVAGVVLGTEVALAGLGLFIDRWDPSAVRSSIWRIGGGLGALVMLGSVAYDHLKDRVRSGELRKERAERELLLARVENLQSRLNPHFLFNSLNTVASLIEEDTEGAVKAVEELSDLLRYALEGTQEQFVSVEREVEAIERYLAIEKRRFGSRLSWAIDVDPQAASAQVPALLLQPIVENSVKHAVATRREGARVEVGIVADGGHLKIELRDDGSGQSSVPGTNTGEANSRQRLELLYGSQATFEAGPVREGGYRVRISLPRGGPGDVA